MISAVNAGCSTSSAFFRSGGMGSASGTGTTGQGTSQADLTEEQLAEVEQLKSRDRQVRAHEAAHQAAAGEFATSGAQFTYQRGPDGIAYAIGGEVDIDTSAIAGDPTATLRKAETIRRAALAPAEPSGQDRQVAAKAGQMAAEARAEISTQPKGQAKTNLFKAVETGNNDKQSTIDLRA